jgi:Pyruvate/2-oxoacid:ferredoxin oxidoreductase delta subunit
MYKGKINFKMHLPVIEVSKCTNCDMCYIVCPKNAIRKVTSNACAKCIKYCISMEVPCNPESYVYDYKNCDSCGLCLMECPSKAIYWHKVKN